MQLIIFCFKMHGNRHEHPIQPWLDTPIRHVANNHLSKIKLTWFLIPMCADDAHGYPILHITAVRTWHWAAMVVIVVCREQKLD